MKHLAAFLIFNRSVTAIASNFIMLKFMYYKFLKFYKIVMNKALHQNCKTCVTRDK